MIDPANAQWLLCEPRVLTLNNSGFHPLSLCTVELGYNVTKGTEYFVSL
jgi:hypothetical protein